MCFFRFFGEKFLQLWRVPFRAAILQRHGSGEMHAAHALDPP